MIMQQLTQLGRDIYSPVICAKRQIFYIRCAVLKYHRVFNLVCFLGFSRLF